MAPLLAVSAFTGKGWEAEAKPSWARSEVGSITGRGGMSGTITVGHPLEKRSDNEPGSVFTERVAGVGVAGIMRLWARMG